MCSGRKRSVLPELDAARDQIEALKAILHNDRTAYRSAVAAMQSQPRLQQVTPEAMEELERRDTCEIVLFSGGMVLRLKWISEFRCWAAALTALKSRPKTGWFIDLSTIPEVT